MATSLVLTVIGSDQPGLVEALSRVVAENGGSWEGSRMARLAGCFAGILEVRVPQNRATSLCTALRELEGQGLRVVVEDASSDEATEPYRVLQLELVGQDRPGIIHDISSALAVLGVNVVELATECSSAPMSGETLFNATARLHLPFSLPLAELSETLEKIAADLMVDISLDESEGDPTGD